MIIHNMGNIDMQLALTLFSNYNIIYETKAVPPTLLTRYFFNWTRKYFKFKADKDRGNSY